MKWKNSLFIGIFCGMMVQPFYAMEEDENAKNVSHEVIPTNPAGKTTVLEELVEDKDPMLPKQGNIFDLSTYRRVLNAVKIIYKEVKSHAKKSKNKEETLLQDETIESYKETLCLLKLWKGSLTWNLSESKALYDELIGYFKMEEEIRLSWKEVPTAISVGFFLDPVISTATTASILGMNLWLAYDANQNTQDASINWATPPFSYNEIRNGELCGIEIVESYLNGTIKVSNDDVHMFCPKIYPGNDSISFSPVPGSNEEVFVAYYLGDALYATLNSNKHTALIYGNPNLREGLVKVIKYTIGSRLSNISSSWYIAPLATAGALALKKAGTYFTRWWLPS